MTENLVKLEPLAEKDVHVTVELRDEEQWARALHDDPELPRSEAELRRMISQVYRLPSAGPAAASSPDPAAPSMEECGESAHARIVRALGGPFLSTSARSALAVEMAAAVPHLERRLKTDHFDLRWTAASEDPRDNVPDPAVIEETAEYLEHAWAVLHATFGRAPYVPAGRSRIDVHFRNSAYLGVASPPDGPILFDADRWVAKPGVRRPTSAHELFHKLQYAFGYQRPHLPSGDFKWFSEGTATWAEVLVWNRLSRDTKLLSLFLNPDQPLFGSSYRALPFWLHLQASLAAPDSPEPILELLRAYEAGGRARAALEHVVRSLAADDVQRELAGFFAAFSARRAQPGSIAEAIAGQAGHPLVPAVRRADHALTPGVLLHIPETVGAFASDYHRVRLDPSTSGRRLVIEIHGTGGRDFRFHILGERDGEVTGTRDAHLFDEVVLVDETVDLGLYDALHLVVSCGDQGGSYAIRAAVDDAAPA